MKKIIIFLYYINRILANNEFLYQMNEVIPSCKGSVKVKSDVNFCDSVTWVAAKVYNSSSFSVYNDNEPLSVDEQDNFAKSLYNSIIPESSTPTSCHRAAKRFACALVFPE